MVQMLALVLATLVVAILRVDRYIVRALRAEGALSPNRAVPFALGNPLTRWRLHRLIGRRAIIRVNDSDLLYLDESGWEAFRSWRRRRVLHAFVVVLPVALLLLCAHLS